MRLKLGKTGIEKFTVYQASTSDFLFLYTHHISDPLTICVHHCAATAHLSIGALNFILARDYSYIAHNLLHSFGASLREPQIHEKPEAVYIHLFICTCSCMAMT